MNKLLLLLGSLCLALAGCQSTQPEPAAAAPAPVQEEEPSAPLAAPTRPEEARAARQPAPEPDPAPEAVARQDPASAPEPSSEPVVAELSERDRAIADRLGLDPENLARLIEIPLYEFSESDLNTYLPYLQEIEPDLRSRVVHLARKNIGQPYELYLLGEFPFETHDPLPLYNLEKSDCVVFAEHVYSMALTENWPSFFKLLQRIRYVDGQIGVATRNHYTEADWNPNNAWLVEDISRELAGEKTATYQQRVDRSGFLKNRYKIDRDIPVQNIQEEFVPFDAVGPIKDRLQDGDFVNIVKGRNGGLWVGHVGLIGIGDDGTVNLIHSTNPRVREEPLDDYIRRGTARLEERDAAGKTRIYGFKFLRLRENPLANLVAIDGADAPRVQPSVDALATSSMEEASPSSPAVTPGIDALLGDQRDLLRGKKVGLITNPTGITADGRQNIDALAADPEIDLVALFGPEHGVRGEHYAGDKVGSETDAVTGLPVHSLYGATRRPKAEWIEGLDALVYDIMDTGNRSYTYIYTMAYAMEAARDAGIPFIVCDRPNPMGGELVDGNILDTSKGTSFVGLYPIAYLYGMTPGELARYFNAEFDINCDLRVVEMKGWDRKMTYDETGLLWVLPSQHVPRYESSYFLALTGTTGELHTVSIGVGFTLPFEMVGAPWIERQELADELNSRDIPGLHFRPTIFVPRYGTYDGEKCQAVQIHITDFSQVRPVSAGIHVMEALQELYPDEKPLGDEENSTSGSRIAMFNKVMGTDEVRLALLEGKSADEIIASWQPEMEAFMETREQYLIYK